MVRVTKFLKEKWRDIAITLLLLNLLFATVIPAMADMIQIQPINPGLWEIDGSETELIAASDVDFQKYKAIAMVCDNGATLPASANTGQWFLHTPTGRNILYQYDGSNWGSIISIGSMTVYVDKTDGTDDLNHGIAVDGDAFATVQYAADCIPGLFGGSVTININSESYTEAVVVRGKKAIGDYIITLQGTLSLQESATAVSMIAGSGATQGTLTDTGAFAGDSYANLLLHVATLDEYRIIDSHTDDVITITGVFSGAGAYVWTVYDWATTIQRIQLAPTQAGVYLNDIKISGAAPVLSGKYSELTLTRCSILVGSTQWIEGLMDCYQCYGTGAVWATFAVAAGGHLTIWYSKICCTSDTGNCIKLAYGGVIYLRFGSILDGDAGGGNRATRGAYATTNSVSSFYAAVAQGYNRVRNCDTGIYSEKGSVCVDTVSNQYSGNGNNEDPDAASFGYID